MRRPSNASARRSAHCSTSCAAPYNATAAVSPRGRPKTSPRRRGRIPARRKHRARTAGHRRLRGSFVHFLLPQRPRPRTELPIECPAGGCGEYSCAGERAAGGGAAAAGGCGAGAGARAGTRVAKTAVVGFLEPHWTGLVSLSFVTGWLGCGAALAWLGDIAIGVAVQPYALALRHGWGRSFTL